MKPICVPCRRFFRPKRNGFAFEEGFPTGGHNFTVDEPHNVQCTQLVLVDNEPVPCSRTRDAHWSAYKLWLGDLWECKGCGAEIVITLPTQDAIAEHYQPTYAEMVRTFPPQLRINDC